MGYKENNDKTRDTLFTLYYSVLPSIRM